MIRLEGLRVFATVAESGNIKDAAQRLGRTPSAVSMTLKQIEDQLGAPLFQSDRKHSLTDLGLLMRDMAGVLLRDFDRAMEVIRAHAEGRAGRLRVASVPSVAAMLLPDVVEALVAARPGVEIALIDTDSVGVHALVETGQVDIGIASAVPRSAGLAFAPLFVDPFLLVCRAGSALAKHKGPITWRMLEEHGMIVNEASRAIASPGFQALAQRARLTVRNVTSLLALVQSGAGVTLLPALATANLPPALRAMPLADRVATRTVGVLGRQDRIVSPVVAPFRALLLGTVRQRAKRLGLSLPAAGLAA